MESNGKAEKVQGPPAPVFPTHEVERLTEEFRAEIARRHALRAELALTDYWAALGGLGDTPMHLVTANTRKALTSRRWHAARKTGQLLRFKRIRSCGSRVVIATCGVCGHSRTPILEGCGVARACSRCALRNAKHRRARFGRARAKAIIDGCAFGLLDRHRANGRYSGKMLTLTMPHFALEEASGAVRAEPRSFSTISARVAALWLAWPRFLRKWTAHWKDVREAHVAYHRAFEWTPGQDWLGHPHFHVWMWCPFIDADYVRSMWREALHEVGVPLRADGYVSIDIRSLHDDDELDDLTAARAAFASAREVIKGGRREALTFSRVRKGAAFGVRGRPNAVEYSEGWSIADVIDDCEPPTLAHLYCALEARRLSQASAGFYADDPPCECEVCHFSAFTVRFEGSAPHPGVARTTPPTEHHPPWQQTQTS